MKMTIPVFRAGRYSNGDIKAMVPDGVVTTAHIKEIAENTGKAMTKTTWRPRAKAGHGKGRDTIGWIEKPPVARGRHLMAEVDLNADGEALIKGKKARFWSSEIDTGRSLYGDDDSEKLGLRLGAVAWLTSEDPQIKDLGDSFSAAEFSEEDIKDMADAGFRVVRECIREEADRIAYFAEIEEVQPQQPPSTATQEKPMKTVEQLQAELDAANAKAAAAEEKADKAAKAAAFGEKRNAFIEHVRNVKAIVAKAQKDLKLGASAAASAIEIGIAMFGQESAGAELVADFSDVIVEEKVSVKQSKPIALFEEFVKNLGVVVPTERLPEGESPDPAMKLTGADFAEIATNSEKAKKVYAVFEKAQAKNPKLTFEEFRTSTLAN